MTTPRLLIAGLNGGSGKTLLSIGVLAAWRRSGHAVAAFKKGPDYIDAAWLSRAAGSPCRNLDLFLMSPDAIRGSFAAATGRADVALVEGNRGLFDGADARGTYSTAELAKLLRTPVVLVVDCTKSTRTVAALVLGCQQLDPDVPIRGVILNRVAGSRHETVVRQAVADACQLPVLGALPRLEPHPFPERHLGLVPPEEHAQLDTAVAHAADIAERYLDLHAMLGIARGAPTLPAWSTAWPDTTPATTARVGVFRDAAFQFYYPENLEALARAGAYLIEISPLADGDLPDLDALYVGGGFPETAAGALADNRAFRASVRDAVAAGLPVYAECGGAVYLGTQLVIEGRTYPMVGALPAVFGFAERPRGHGYAELETVTPNPFFDVGQSIVGHEFHYTFLETLTADTVSFAFRVRRGHGCGGRSDGLCHRNVLASYTHVHALGTPAWAPGVLRAARRCQTADARASGVGA
ncbi:MAG: cobyrinate a,c-diamide synthase [Gemmatimonadota bacterium]|nr:cobyrinate a,c-diamide synthase [Gemmatimonadota bacterium]